MISENLFYLRKLNNLSQEAVAEKLGISRQAIAKWENGDTIPDIKHCIALSKLYDVSLDDLVNYSPKAANGIPVPPKGKHFFGNVTLNEKGQIVIPKKAREIFHLKPGDELSLLGDEAQGLALVKTENILRLFAQIEKGGNKNE